MDTNTEEITHTMPQSKISPMAHIVVLGGGISGLSTAYYLSKGVEQGVRITIIEGSSRFGGWIRSQRVTPGDHFQGNVKEVKINDKDNVLFECGPRSLRPVGTSGVVLLEMIRDLNLANLLIKVPKSDPSTQNRYVYYDGSINTLPNSFYSILFSRPPVFKSVIMAGIRELFISPKQDNNDESVYDFVARRFNEHIAQNLVGAMIHGIYAGDAKKLSVLSTLKMLSHNERAFGSVIKGMFQGGAKIERFQECEMGARIRKEDPDWYGSMEKLRSYGFPDGIETLPKHLTEWLKHRENVELINDEWIEELQFGEKVKIKTSKTTLYADHVISTLSPQALDKIIHGKIPHLSYNTSVDVAVVNFAYKDLKMQYNGFGFLVPHPSSSSRNPVPGVLGVVFDSNALSGQENFPVTKLTVMLGGHMWNETFGEAITTIDPAIVRQRALDALSAFLDIHEKPDYSLTNLNSQCIPQYYVGHESRLAEMHKVMKETFGHSFSVTGSGYWGVGVPDCVKNSRELVEELLVSGALGSREKVVTGLGRVEK